MLRQIAKEFAVYDDFLQNVSLNSYENISIACYYIGITCKDYSGLQPKLDFILPYIDNWAICDTFVSSLKCLKKASLSKESRDPQEVFDPVAILPMVIG